MAQRKRRARYDVAGASYTVAELAEALGCTEAVATRLANAAGPSRLTWSRLADAAKGSHASATSPFKRKKLMRGWWHVRYYDKRLRKWGPWIPHAGIEEPK